MRIELGVVDNAHEPNSPLAIARFGAFALGQQEDMRFGLKSSPKLPAATSDTRKTLYAMPCLILKRRCEK